VAISSRPEDLAGFLVANDGVRVAFHDAAFALAVLQDAAPARDVYQAVDGNLVWETLLLHRLLVLATEGHTASGVGESTLERCAEIYLNMSHSGGAVDCRDSPIDLTASERRSFRFSEVEPAYLAHLARDANVTYRLYRRLRKRIKECLGEASGAWGYVSAGWLREQVRRWGPLTHHIQLRASIALKAVTAAGLPIDLRRHAALVKELEAAASASLPVLRRGGYTSGRKGAAEVLQSALAGSTGSIRNWNFAARRPACTRRPRRTSPPSPPSSRSSRRTWRTPPPRR